MAYKNRGWPQAKISSSALESVLINYGREFKIDHNFLFRVCLGPAKFHSEKRKSITNIVYIDLKLWKFPREDAKCWIENAGEGYLNSQKKKKKQKIAGQGLSNCWSSYVTHTAAILFEKQTIFLYHSLVISVPFLLNLSLKVSPKKKKKP